MTDFGQEVKAIDGLNLAYDPYYDRFTLKMD